MESAGGERHDTAQGGKPEAVQTADPTEVSLGIQSYLTAGAGFSGVSKARYSDFLVNEVNNHGQVARLTDMTGSILQDSAGPATSGDKQPETTTAGSKRKREDADPGEKQGTQEPGWDNAEKELQDLLERSSTIKESAAFAKRIVQFGQSTESDPNQKLLEIPLNETATKEQRTELHTWIRSSPLSKNVVADTHKQPVASKEDPQKSVDQCIIRVWHKKFKPEMPGNRRDRDGGRGRGPRPARDQPYLQFVLYKENMDTGAALQQIQHRFESMGRGGGRGRGRGRGGRNNNQRLRIGHAGMKDKRGITGQFVTVPSSTSISQLLSLNASRNPSRGGAGHTQSGGAALLRVGNFAFVKEELRLGRLMGNQFNVVLRNIQSGSTSGDTDRDFHRTILLESANGLKESGFVNYFGIQRFGKYHDTHLTGIAVLQKDFERAIDVIMRPNPENNERQNVRDARKAWVERFSGIKAEEAENRSVRAKAEQVAAQQMLEECGRFLNNERSICHSLARNPLDYQRAYSGINKTMRMMFVHAVQSLVWNQLATYRIEKVPQGRSGVVPGDLVLQSDTADEQEGQVPAVHVVTEEDVAESKYHLEDVVLPIVGSKTVIPSYGREIMNDLLREQGLTLQTIQEYADRDFACPGDYRKLVCIPKDVAVELLEYTNPLEPLVQTDLMKHDGIELAAKAAGSSSEAAPLLGMRIQFTLPSSAYATIALRELMKRPTSAEYQGGLDLGGTKADNTAPIAED